MKRKPDCWMCRGLEKENPLTIAEFTYSVARMNRDQYFRGYTFLVFKYHETELYSLDEATRTGFVQEMIRLASALDVVFKPDKMNYELLGNAMPHLHWHVIPRYKREPLWGQPVWVREHLERRLGYAQYQRQIEQIQTALRNPGV